MGWREKISTAVDAWLKLEGGAGRSASWTPVGRAVRTGDSGVFTVDVRGKDTPTDQLDSLRLAGPEDPTGESGYSVLEAAQSGSALTVRVAEFADPQDGYTAPFCTANREAEMREAHAYFSARRKRPSIWVSGLRRSPDPRMPTPRVQCSTGPGALLVGGQ